jgi:hypothetical protein
MKTKLKILLLSCWLACLSFSAEVVIVVNDCKIERIPGVPLREGFNTIQKKTAFTVDTADLKIISSTETHGRKIPAIAQYTVVEGNACAGGHALFPAYRILYQGRIEGNDLLVTLTPYGSFNPIYWPAALTGHSIQFEDLWVRTVDGNGLIKESRLIKRAHAASWAISVFEPAPIKAP